MEKFQTVNDEAYLISIILSDQKALIEASTILNASDFSSEINSLIYQTSLQLFEKSVKLDSLTIYNSFDDAVKKQLEMLGGASYIEKIRKLPHNASNLKHNIDKIKSGSIKRQIVSSFNTIEEELEKDAELSVDGIIGKCESQILDIGLKNKPINTMSDKLATNYEELLEERIRLASLEELPGIRTGFNELDNILLGLQEGELVVLGGRLKSGKCLSGDSMVQMVDGSLITIKEIYETGVNKAVQSMVDFQVKPSCILGACESGVQSVYNLATSRGKEIKATENHKFLTEFGWKELKHIKVGDLVATPNIILSGKKEIPDDDVILMAYLLGDGSISDKSKNVTFTNCNQELLDEFEGIIIRKGFSCRKYAKRNKKTGVVTYGYHVHKVNGNKKDYDKSFANVLSNKLVEDDMNQIELSRKLGVGTGSVSCWINGKNIPDRENLDKVLELFPDILDSLVLSNVNFIRMNPLDSWFEKYNIKRGVAATKEIPYIIFQLSERQIALFINRIWSCAGWVSFCGENKTRAQIGYGSTSRELVFGLQNLLLRLGVSARLREREKSFALEVNQNPESKTTFAYKIDVFGRKPQMEYLKSVLPKIKPKNNMKKVGDILFDEVTSIAHVGDEMTYDIQTSSGNFIANNIIVHNSSLLSNIARNVALNESKRLLYVDTELSSKEVSDRLVSMVSGVEYRKVVTGRWSSYEYDLIRKAAEKLNKSNFYHVYIPNFSEDVLVNLARKYKLQKGIDLLVFDYIKSPTSQTFRSIQEFQYLGVLTDLIKNKIAGTLNIATLAGVQLNRNAVGAVENDSGQISGSDRIAAFSNVVLYIREKSDREISSEEGKLGNMVLTIGESRSTAKGISFDLNFRKSTLSFQEIGVRD
mgnify:CR=1 FL=1